MLKKKRARTRKHFFLSAPLSFFPQLFFDSFASGFPQLQIPCGEFFFLFFFVPLEGTPVKKKKKKNCSPPFFILRGEREGRREKKAGLSLPPPPLFFPRLLSRPEDPDFAAAAGKLGTARRRLIPSRASARVRERERERAHERQRERGEVGFGGKEREENFFHSPRKKNYFPKNVERLLPTQCSGQR